MLPTNYSKLTKIITGSIIVFVVFLILLYSFAFTAPSQSNGEITVTIESGLSLRGIANKLKDSHVIRSAGAAQSLMVFFGGERSVKAGLYMFKTPQNAITVAKRIVRGDYGYDPVKITIPEGTNSNKIGEIVHSKFPLIDAGRVENLAEAKEGYLFPDTYFFPPVASAEEIIQRMSDAFETKLKPYADEIKGSGRSMEDIIKMASILEEEVQTTKDRKMVADLLWRRLDMGMALQVDSTLGYVLGKTSAELTLADLKRDSPYNTYLNKGLPITPISNPGIDTIEASLRPISNPYLFYLSDNDGITHFAETYAEHLKNKRKYID